MDFATGSVGVGRLGVARTTAPS
eukprot:SAG31_NODE_36823_length_310_cov_0.492891_1_plen_22_part_01